jgi:hypothetical protein
MNISRLDAFERSVYADILAVALLAVILAAFWMAGAI